MQGLNNKYGLTLCGCVKKVVLDFLSHGSPLSVLGCKLNWPMMLTTGREAYQSGFVTSLGNWSESRSVNIGDTKKHPHAYVP